MNWFTLSASRLIQHAGRLPVIINCHKGETPRDGFLSVLIVHLLQEDINLNIKAGGPYLTYLTHQFYDGASGYRLLKVNTIRRNRDTAFAGKAGGGNESNLIHQGHGRTAKERVVMVGSIGEYRFENAGFRRLYERLKVQKERFCCYCKVQPFVITAGAGISKGIGVGHITISYWLSVLFS